MPAIRFENVAKRFTIHHERPRSLQELLLQAFRRRGWREEFWALRDVSFAVAPGEALGVIGTNGSGKSTLLKLATRLLRPTRGRVEVHGRVAALLELGAGFHPELSGRDNIYLHAAVLGIPRRRVEERFADIVAFAGLERFVDTPLKHYSAGMQARLGFAVAVHVDPEVLLLDEVLAVGDLQFQARCLERIRALHAEGRTVLLVSHDLQAVTELCTQALWLHEGRVRAIGPPAEVVAAYRRYLLGEAPADGAAAPERRWGSGEVQLVAVELLDERGQPTQRFVTGAPLTVRLRYRARQRVRRPVFGIAFHAGGVHLAGPNTRVDGFPLESIAGEGEVLYRIEALPLLPGAYTLSAAVYDERELHPFDHHHQGYSFLVVSGDGVERYGLLQLAGRWTHRAIAPGPAVGARSEDAAATPRRREGAALGARTADGDGL
ncbi:MAG TPA: ABC transporter ATP-binding protein [Chloroflexota bacterium]|nr:ABC transporter ATP-binding protein [Chloroflexota bacterium]